MLPEQDEDHTNLLYGILWDGPTGACFGKNANEERKTRHFGFYLITRGRSTAVEKGY